MKELVPNKKSEPVLFAQSVREALDKTDLDTDHNVSAGCIFESGKFACISKGSLLEVVNIKSGLQCSACDFSLLNQKVVITCVISCKNKFIVGLRCNGASNSGMLCAYDLGVSRITKAIKLQCVPISLALVREFGGVSYETSLINTALRCMFGIIAVGTEDGHLLLIDIRADDDYADATLTSPSSLLQINACDSANIPAMRDKGRSCGQHCCFDLTSDSVTNAVYKYSAPGGGILKACDITNCGITCLLYLKQSLSLVVGYSFGAFQIWSLGSLEIIYSSPVPLSSPPVSHLTYQEPENDPRNCFFLWVGRGPLPSQTECLDPSSVTLYQIVYGSKELINGYGILYKDLGLLVKRFDHQLTADVHHLVDSTSVGSRIVSFNTLDPSESTVCMIVWETPMTDANSSMSCHLGIFDLNCYYEKQLPRSVREAMYGKMEAICPFFAFYLLTDIAEDFLPGGILDVYLDVKSIDWFRTSVSPQTEQFSWPSSASFKLTCLSEIGTIEVEMLGMQKQIISDMIKMGADSFLDIGNLIQACCVSGLLHNSFGVIKENEDNLHTDALLSIALDHGGMIFITSCIKKWSHGSIAHAGHSLKLLHDWAWSQVVQRKRFLDGLHFFLFDSVEDGLDDGQLNQLKKISVQLRDLSEILNELKNCKASSLDEGIQELEMKSQVTLHLAMYADVLLLLVDCLLLPEQSCHSETGTTTYNAKLLSDYYEVHRTTAGNDDSLFIDVMWKSMDFPETLKEENNDVVLYPPSSVEVMCSLFVHNMPNNMPNDDKKNCFIFYYWFLDMCECYTHLQAKNAESKFKQFMKLSNSEELLVKSTWLLDHKLYSEALTHMLMVDVKISSLYYHHIVKLLFKQGEKDLLALFFTNKRPNDSCSFEQMKFLIYVMLQMGKLSNAYELQSSSIKPSLFNYFIEQCLENKLLQRLMMLPLNPEEENALHNYLLTSKGNKDYLLVYYLKRGLFTEALKLTKSLKAVSVLKLDQVDQNHLQTQCLLANGFSQIIPHIQQKRTNNMEKCSSSPAFKTPLSSVLIKGDANMSPNSLFSSGPENDSFNKNLFANPSAKRRKSPLFDVEPIFSKKQKEMDVSIPNFEMSPEMLNKKSTPLDSNPLSLLTTPASAKRSYSKISVGSLKPPQSILKMKPYVQQNVDLSEIPISSGKRIRFVDSRSPSGVNSSMDGSFIENQDKVEVSFISNSSFASAPEVTQENEIKESVDDKETSPQNDVSLGSFSPESILSGTSDDLSKSVDVENILNDLDNLDEETTEKPLKPRRLSLHAEESINEILKSKYVLHTPKHEYAENVCQSTDTTISNFQTPQAELCQSTDTTRSSFETPLAELAMPEGVLLTGKVDVESPTDGSRESADEELSSENSDIDVKSVLDVTDEAIAVDAIRSGNDSSSAPSDNDDTYNNTVSFVSINNEVMSPRRQTVTSDDENDEPNSDFGKNILCERREFIKTYDHRDAELDSDLDNEVLPQKQEFIKTYDHEGAQKDGDFDSNVLHEKREFVISDSDEDEGDRKYDKTLKCDDDIYENMDITSDSNEATENIDSFLSAVDSNDNRNSETPNKIFNVSKHDIGWEPSGSKTTELPAENLVEVTSTVPLSDKIGDTQKEMLNDRVEDNIDDVEDTVINREAALNDTMGSIISQDVTLEIHGTATDTSQVSPRMSSADEDGERTEVSLGNKGHISSVDSVEMEEEVCMEYKTDDEIGLGNAIMESRPVAPMETKKSNDDLRGRDSNENQDYSDDVAVADVINIDDDDTDGSDGEIDDSTDGNSSSSDGEIEDDTDDNDISDGDDDASDYDKIKSDEDIDMHADVSPVAVVVLDDDDDDDDGDDDDDDDDDDDENNDNDVNDDDNDLSYEEDIGHEGRDIETAEYDDTGEQNGSDNNYANKVDFDIEGNITAEQSSILPQHGQISSLERTEPIPIEASPEKHIENDECEIINRITEIEDSEDGHSVELVDEHNKDIDGKTDIEVSPEKDVNEVGEDAGSEFLETKRKSDRVDFSILPGDGDTKSTSGVDTQKRETLKDAFQDDLGEMEYQEEASDSQCYTETEHLKEVSEEGNAVISRETVLEYKMKDVSDLSYTFDASTDTQESSLLTIIKGKEDTKVVEDECSSRCSPVIPSVSSEKEVVSVPVEKNKEKDACMEYISSDKGSTLEVATPVIPTVGLESPVLAIDDMEGPDAVSDMELPVKVTDDMEGAVTGDMEGPVTVTVTDVEEPVTVTDDLEKAVTVMEDVEGPITVMDDVEGPVTVMDDVEGPVTVMDDVEGSVTVMDDVDGPVTVMDDVEGPVTVVDVEGHVAPMDDVDMEDNLCDDHLAVATMKVIEIEKEIVRNKEITVEEMYGDVMKGVGNKLDLKAKKIELTLDEIEQSVSVGRGNIDMHKSEESIILTDVCDISSSNLNTITNDNPELIRKMEEMDVKKEAGSMEWQSNLEGSDCAPNMTAGRSPVFLPAKIGDVSERHSDNSSSEDNGSVITPVRTLRRRTVYRRDLLTPRTNKFRIKPNSDSALPEEASMGEISEQDLQVWDSDAQVYRERYNTAKVIQQNKSDVTSMQSTSTSEYRKTRRSTRHNTPEAKSDSSSISNSDAQKGEDVRKKQAEGNSKYFIIDDDDQSSSEDIEIESDDLEMYLGLKRKSVGRTRGHVKGKDMSPIKEEVLLYQEPEEENVDEYCNKESEYKNDGLLHIETCNESDKSSKEPKDQGTEESSEDEESEDDEPTKCVTRSQIRLAARLTRARSKLQTVKSSPVKKLTPVKSPPVKKLTPVKSPVVKKLTPKKRSKTYKSPEVKVDISMPMEIKEFENHEKESLNVSKDSSTSSSQVSCVSRSDVPDGDEKVDGYYIPSVIRSDQINQRTEEPSDTDDSEDDEPVISRRTTRSQNRFSSFTRSQGKVETVKSSLPKKSRAKRRTKTLIKSSQKEINLPEVQNVEVNLPQEYQDTIKESSLDAGTDGSTRISCVDSITVSDFSEEEEAPPRITRSRRNTSSTSFSIQSEAPRITRSSRTMSSTSFSMQSEGQLVINNEDDGSSQIGLNNLSANMEPNIKSLDEIKHSLPLSKSKNKKRPVKRLSTRASNRKSAAHVDKTLVDINVNISPLQEGTHILGSSILTGGHHSPDKLSSSSVMFISQHMADELTDDNSTVHSGDGASKDETSATVGHEESSDNISPVRQLKSYPTRHGDKNKSLLNNSFNNTPPKSTDKKSTVPKILGNPQNKSVLEVETSSSEITDKKIEQKPQKRGRPKRNIATETLSVTPDRIDTPREVKPKASRGRVAVVARNLRKRNVKM